MILQLAEYLSAQPPGAISIQQFSSSGGHRFYSVFDGSEFFFADHQVNGQSMLSAVSYLEMIHGALIQVLSSDHRAVSPQIYLQQHTWLRPVVVIDEPCELVVDLQPNGQYQQFAYQISDQHHQICAQGLVGWRQSPAAAEVSGLVPSQLQAECTGQMISGETFYPKFDKLGINYGTSHRIVEQVWMGTQQLVARLTLPSMFSNTIADRVLHPSVMDGALQAAMLLILAEDAKTPALPFAVQIVEVWRPCPPQIWV